MSETLENQVPETRAVSDVADEAARKYAEEKRQALASWASELVDIVSQKTSLSNVVKMQG